MATSAEANEQKCLLEQMSQSVAAEFILRRFVRPIIYRGTSCMKKLFLVVIGLLLGVLLTEIVRRPKMQQLRDFEEKAARRKERFAEDEKVWQAELAAMPFAERMDWELFEAALKQSNYQPDWDDNIAGGDYAPQR